MEQLNDDQRMVVASHPPAVASTTRSSSNLSSPKARLDDCHDDDDAGLSSTQVVISAEDMQFFPPFPKPNYELKRKEMINGIAFVTILILVFVGLTHGVALTVVDSFEKKSPPWWTFLILIYGCALVAMISLMLLLTLDPGYVQRTTESCFPIPSSVKPWVSSHVKKCKERETNQSLKDSNLRVDDDDDNNEDFNDDRPTEVYIQSPCGNGDSYCVRCLVWRKYVVNDTAGVRYFHCNTCQRCVQYFDHHCSVFGRCIAGHSGRKGNILFFWILIGCALLAFIVTAISLIWSLSLRYGAKLVVPISLVVLYLLHANLIAKGSPISLCMSCRKVVVMFAECCCCHFHGGNNSAGGDRSRR